MFKCETNNGEKNKAKQKILKKKGKTNKKFNFLLFFKMMIELEQMNTFQILEENGEAKRVRYNYNVSKVIEVCGKQVGLTSYLKLNFDFFVVIGVSEGSNNVL